MNLSPAGLEFIKRFEGLRLTAYQDVGGVWTVGYGHTGPDVFEGRTIGAGQADALLRFDVRSAEDAVNELVAVPLSQAQFDALVSFTFNLGAANLRMSTLLKRLNAGEYDSVPSELMKWVHAKGKVVGGLVSRRAAEGALWRSGGMTAPAPAPRLGLWARIKSLLWS